MARDAEAASYTLNLWQKLVSWAYIAGGSKRSILICWILELARFLICYLNADLVSASSFSTSYPTYPPSLSSRANALLQPLRILAVLETVLSPVSTLAFNIRIIQRETTYIKDILYFGSSAISTVVAAVVLALQTLILKSPREDTWNILVGGNLPLVAFILFLVPGGLQIVAVLARRLILPKQFRPFVMEKYKRTSAIGEPEARALGIELVAGIDSGPLARLYHDYEKQGLVSRHIDLEPYDREDFIRLGTNERWRKEETGRRAFQEVDLGSYRYRDRLKIVILLSTVYFLLSVGFETLRFAVNRRSNGAYQWLYIFGLIYPWPLAIWIVTVLISVQYRFALQRKVLGIIRIDRLLTIIFVISILPGPICEFARIIIDGGFKSTWVFIWWDGFNLLFCFLAMSFSLAGALALVFRSALAWLI